VLKIGIFCYIICGRPISDVMTPCAGTEPDLPTAAWKLEESGGTDMVKVDLDKLRLTMYRCMIKVNTNLYFL